MCCDCKEDRWEGEINAEEVRELMREWVRAKKHQDFESFDNYLLCQFPTDHRLAHYWYEGFSATTVS